MRIAVVGSGIMGSGMAEGFKFGPVAGEYVAQRVLGVVGDPAVAKAFVPPAMFPV